MRQIAIAIPLLLSHSTRPTFFLKGKKTPYDLALRKREKWTAPDGLITRLENCKKKKSIEILQMTSISM